MAKVTFLGTGLMGSALAEAAKKRGDEVVVWNRTIEKARALEVHGIRVAASPEEAVKGADRVHTVLTDDAVLDALVAQLRSAIGDAVLVDHTTASPAGTAARAKDLASQGIAFLHAPVFMSPAMCLSAGGIMLASGPEKLFDRVASELQKMTGNLRYLGERADLAAANKLFGNAMILTITAGLSDVYAMAASLDIPATDAHALFSTFNPLGVIAYRGAAMARADYKASFELVMARKDVRLMIETANRGAKSLGVLPAIAKRMDELIERGHGEADLGVLALDSVPTPD